MAISPNIMINKSGVTVPVYGSDWTTVVGALNNREAFAQYGLEGDYISISYLNPSGVFTSGMLKAPPEGTLTGCTSYPYGTAQIDGQTYYTFYMRKTKNVVTTANTYWGTVAAGRRVACRTSLAGQNYQYLKGINYVENTSGVWVQVTGNGDSYGFVDTGLRTSSSASGIAMYGSW